MLLNMPPLVVRQFPLLFSSYKTYGVYAAKSLCKSYCNTYGLYLAIDMSSADVNCCSCLDVRAKIIYSS